MSLPTGSDLQCSIRLGFNLLTKHMCLLLVVIASICWPDRSEPNESSGKGMLFSQKTQTCQCLLLASFLSDTAGSAKSPCEGRRKASASQSMLM